ncbi:hypothetical protein A2917_00280 [Candidatus Nomurabacteria bacterium RIFCSPLOWO2_01_FULL_42_17]|uniref:Uncharacterized protein n=1 Tax=Candidatus Nomurabacteria bacterium RIFCSPLOWO2_01_FULL_42_17 TaxID=1801780 RepID=A0A1F6XNN7_9BACT|nr:MAG: hypothetical protein A2917_00280 [Candidatus Nomurabacteria bacterium RIFCSPLOWO2_01_FULL_42_17]
MTKNKFVYVVSVIFLIIGILHILRLLNGWEAQIGSFVIPMWISFVAVVVAFYLSFQGFRMAKHN